MDKKTSGGFSSRIGFVLAAAGSAVGLGNIWRFPYLAAKYGGGSFLFLYLILTVTFGFTLMLTEIAIGRKTGKSALYAFSALDSRFKFLGVLASIVPMIIFPYYCVIGGWVVKYMVTYVTGQGVNASQGTFFTDYISSAGEPLLWLCLFIIATMFIILGGVEKGIEKASKILMPVLILITIGIAVYVFTIPGISDGILYYLKPDFQKMSMQAVLAAMGQLFYSMSLAMGIMITYGSYLNKKEDVEAAVHHIELFDTGIAFLAGLIIVPSVFAFSGGDEKALSEGPSLMFVTLPKVFEHMPLGHVVGAVFFTLVLFAALTSSISLMETIVSIIQNKFSVSRRKICISISAGAFVIAVPSSLGFGIWSGIQPLNMSILDFFDFISNNLLMPVVALITCIMVGIVLKPSVIADEVKSSGRFKSEKLYNIFIKYIAPVILVAILISSILNAFGVIHL